MKLVQWTVFIDMLGYRDINGSINSDDEAYEFVNFMEENQKVLRSFDSQSVMDRYKKDETFDLYRYYDVSNCFVSDSLIISYKPKQTSDPDNEDLRLMHSANALFIIGMRLQVFIFKCFSEKGLFLRGGVSNKYCYVKDRFAVGEGLIEAYEAESKIAKVPRIVIHPSVEENKELIAKINLLSEKMYSHRGILQRDKLDGLLFIDYLGYAIATVDKSIPMVMAAAMTNPLMNKMHLENVGLFIERQAQQIEKKLFELRERIAAAADSQETRSRLESVVFKFEWLKNYHNSTVQANPWLLGRLVT